MFNIIKKHPYWSIALAILTLTTLGLSFYFHEYINDNSIVSGIFIVIAALLTSWVAFEKYYTEQRTAKLEKLYFEESLLKQTRLLDNMISKTKFNYTSVENLYLLSKNILKNNDSSDEKKLQLEHIFTKTLNQIQFDFTAEESRKFIVSEIFHDSQKIGPEIFDWIDTFDLEYLRLNYFFLSQITLIANSICKLNDINTDKFEKMLKELLFDYMQDTYKYFYRHIILVVILSKITSIISSDIYKTYDDILKKLNTTKVINLLKIIKKYHKILITELKDKKIGIANLDHETIEEIEKNINSAIKEISKS